MSDVTFFYNERFDGGRRTGLQVDGLPALEHFVPGGENHDPRLLWYFDVAYAVPAAPGSQADALVWFNGHGDEIRVALEEAAEQLVGGIDMDLVPWTFERAGSDGQMRVSVSAVRRLAAVEVGARLRTFIESDWPRLAQTLRPIGEGVPVWPGV